MAEERKLITKLVYMITDRMDLKLGLAKVDVNSVEYIGLASVITDEMAEIALAMGLRKMTTAKALAKKMKKDEAYILQMLDDMAQLGFLEYDWDNKEHQKQWQVPHFVVGCAEYMACHDAFFGDVKTERIEMFDRMTLEPIAPLAQFIPQGGAGIGMQAIPVEQAIPHDSESADFEHLSHWLDKADGKFAAFPCVCRATAAMDGEAVGEIEDDTCMTIGDSARMAVETGIATKYISREEIEAILKRCEDNGYVHQVNRGDGEDKIFCICNCAVGTCKAMRMSQLFNTPNLTASAYRAHVDAEKCVACGKCAEVCPAGAAKLGQKLCTKNGAVQYPKQPLPDDTRWGKHMWNYNYRDDNTKVCHDSGTSPCKSACPAHVSVQGYMKMAADGRYMDALKLIKQDNPFPAVCGSICNRRCEDACTRGLVDSPVAIDDIKRFVAAKELEEQTRYIPAKKYHKGNTEPYTDKIAIIGGGPAGLSCAYFLAGMGYANVTVFDKNSQPGGMLTLGIPNFRLEKDVVKAEIDILREMGVNFKCGVEVGRDVTIAALREEGYKGFYIAIGAQKAAPLGIPGEDTEGVIGGIDFLREVNLGSEVKLGKKVVVVGGGNVAMDVARAAVRLGSEVTVVYRRKEEDMPADKAEVAEAKAEGVKFVFEHKPTEVTGVNGKVKALKCEADTIECDNIIPAIGQVIDWGELDTGAMVKGEKSLAKADAVTYQTAQSDIFVGGDVYTGPKFAIDAIAAGREGAVSLHRYVHKGHSLTIARQRREYHELDKEKIMLTPACFDAPERQIVRHDEAKRKTMRDDRLVFTEDMVKAEASRCLGCGVSVVDENKCIGCGLCTTKCEFDAIHLVRDHPGCGEMVYIEDVYKKVAPYAVKRAGKILIKGLKSKLVKG